MNELFSTTDMTQAYAFERSLPEGDYTMLISLAQPLGVSTNDIRDYLVNGGIEVYSVRLQGGVLQINYHKPAWDEGIGQWQAIIPLLPTLLTAAAVVFGILKIETITKSLIPLILVVGGVSIILVALASKPAEAYFKTCQRC